MRHAHSVNLFGIAAPIPNLRLECACTVLPLRLHRPAPCKPASAAAGSWRCCGPCCCATPGAWRPRPGSRSTCSWGPRTRRGLPPSSHRCTQSFWVMPTHSSMRSHQACCKALRRRRQQGAAAQQRHHRRQAELLVLVFQRAAARPGAAAAAVQEGGPAARQREGLQPAQQQRLARQDWVGQGPPAAAGCAGCGQKVGRRSSCAAAGARAQRTGTARARALQQTTRGTRKVASLLRGFQLCA